MRLEHRFRVPAGLDATWALLLDARAVESILPGLRLDEITADEVAGSVRVDLGDRCVTYRGEAAFQRLDPDVRSLVVEAAGRDDEDGRAASATLALALEPDGEATTVVLLADLDLAGGGPADSAEASAVAGRVVDQLAGGVAGRFRCPSPHTDDPVHQERTALVRRGVGAPVPGHRAPSPVRRAGAALARPATDETARWVQRGAVVACVVALLAVLLWFVRTLRR
jgi:carbon monoxide dehydrogenase subunit G